MGDVPVLIHVFPNAAGADILQFRRELQFDQTAGQVQPVFFRQDRPAGAMQLPYVLWVLFAGYLNLGVWLMNR